MDVIDFSSLLHVYRIKYIQDFIKITPDFAEPPVPTYHFPQHLTKSEKKLKVVKEEFILLKRLLLPSPFAMICFVKSKPVSLGPHDHVETNADVALQGKSTINNIDSFQLSLSLILKT